MTKIITFRADAEFDGREFDFERAKTELLNRFDDWRTIHNPTILSINFGKKHGVYIEGSPHYWYIEVLYEEG